MKTTITIKVWGHKMNQFCIIPTILVTKNSDGFELAFGFTKWCLEIAIGW